PLHAGGTRKTSALVGTLRSTGHPSVRDPATFDRRRVCARLPRRRGDQKTLTSRTPQTRHHTEPTNRAHRGAHLPGLGVHHGGQRETPCGSQPGTHPDPTAPPAHRLCGADPGADRTRALETQTSRGRPTGSTGPTPHTRDLPRGVRGHHLHHGRRSPTNP